jgi:hypothetical protein
MSTLSVVVRLLAIGAMLHFTLGSNYAMGLLAGVVCLLYTMMGE